MKKAIIPVGVLVILGSLGLWFYGRPAYKHYQETRSIEQARKFMARGDYRNASLSARQTLQVNPRNLDACRIIAELAEMSRSPHVLDWRRRIAELEPTVSNKLMVAAAALRVQGAPYPLAAQTLEDLGDSARDVAAYHAISAELALKLNRITEAAAQLEEAARLEPTNELHQLNLAALRLPSTNAGVALEAQATLERLRSSARVGAVALRWLVADKLRRGDLTTAEQYSRQLLADSHHVPDDRLQHLSILQKAKHPGFDEYLRSVQTKAATNALEIYGISSWMIGHGLVDDAMKWMTHCPAQVQAEQPVPLAFVDGYVAKKDWTGLEDFLQEQKWADLEFLRLAFLSRAASEARQSLAADAHWRAAVREAGDRLGPLTALLSLAGNWGRDKAREDLLWRIAQRFFGERWALRELERLYWAGGNTYGLNKLYSTMASYDPKNFVAQNNLVSTCMLLKLNLPKAHELAKELHVQHPGEAIIGATYAYSLHLQGRTGEGLAALEKLKPEALETPPVALYYGVILSAVGDTNKASKYLSIAQRADLLPEEKALIAAAMQTL